MKLKDRSLTPSEQRVRRPGEGLGPNIQINRVLKSPSQSAPYFQKSKPQKHLKKYVW